MHPLSSALFDRNHESWSKRKTEVNCWKVATAFDHGVTWGLNCPNATCVQQQGADVGILVRANGRGSGIIVWREQWVKSQQQALPGIESAMKQHDLGQVKLSELRSSSWHKQCWAFLGLLSRANEIKKPRPLEIWKTGANINSFFIHSASLYTPDTSDSFQPTRRHWGDPWAKSHEFLWISQEVKLWANLYKVGREELKFQQVNTLRTEMTVAIYVKGNN